MYILFVIIIFIFFVNFNTIYEPFKPSPTLISNEKKTNNQIPIFINPNDVPNEYATREDVLENQNVSVQPKEMYYDIFNTNCVFSYNRPPECLIIKGNYVNKIPNKNCEKVCPDLYKKEYNNQKKDEKKINKKESFTNFIDDNRPQNIFGVMKNAVV